MTTRLMKALLEKGDHNVCDIKTNSDRLRPLVNGGVLDLSGVKVDYLDNGALVMADGWTEYKNEKRRKLVPYDNSTGKKVYLLKSAEEFELARLSNVAPQGYEDFFNEDGELVDAFYSSAGDLRFETTMFDFVAGKTEATEGDEVYWNSTSFKYIVGDASAETNCTLVGEVVDADPLFAKALGRPAVTIELAI